MQLNENSQLQVAMQLACNDRQEGWQATQDID